MEPSILVVGPGAVGLAISVGLRQAGLPVAILGRSPRAGRRLLRGFHVTTPDGRRTTVRTGLRHAPALRSPVAAAFFCVKSGDAARAAVAARPWIDGRTTIVALQNGIGHEKIFRRAFGSRRTVIGVCYFAADRPSPNELRLNGGRDVLLARGSGNGDSLAAAAKLLSSARFRVHIKDSEPGMLWTKAAFNAAVNPLGAACAVENGRLLDDPALREISLRALAEAAAAAAAAGHPLDYPDMADKLLRSGRNAPRQRNSMLQDLSAGRRTEIHAILRPFLKAARSRRVPTPTLDMLNSLILRLERKLVF